MPHAFTKHNHYNPCFWTALWNESYFRKYCSDSAQIEPPRSQTVYALNLHAGKVLHTTVERVHYHKNLGVAEIDPESAKRFCARWHPEKYDSMVEYLAAHPERVYLDFEDILRGMEALDHYASLMRVAKLGTFQTLEDEGFTVCFLMDHAMRSYEYMSAKIERSETIGVDKWEYFWQLKGVRGDPAFLARSATVLMCSDWTLWRAPRHRFPLCDSPVMIDRDSVMATLSPRLLLEINLIDFDISRPQRPLVVREDLPEHKFAEFQRRSVANSFKEIIFHDAQVLQAWLLSEPVATRIDVLSDTAKTRDSIRDAASRIDYGLSGFGRFPEQLESWATSRLSSRS